MFDQTFVDDAQTTGKPLTLLLSTLIQICILGILLFIPLIYTATLPGTILRSFLVAPRPPTIPAPLHAHRVQPSRFVKVFSGRELVAPVVVPRHVNPVNDTGAPPDIAGLAAVGSTDGAPGSSFVGTPIPLPSTPPALPESKPKSVNASPIRIGTGAAEAKLIDKVLPVYPALAKSARVQGVVEFSAVISKEGNIQNLQLVRGHPLLVKAARDAVLQWKYRPTLLNGKPVEVLTDIVVNFTLTS